MMTTASTPSPFAVFRHNAFSRLWTAQCVSQFGNGLTAIAASVLIYQSTGSALSVGLMLVATVLPSLLIGLVAGVLVDRSNRRTIMVLSDLLRAVLIGLIPVLVPSSVAWLYMLVFLSSCVTQFFDPALESVLPESAPDEELAAANAFMTMSYSGAQALGFAIAGLIAARFPIGWTFGLDALSFVLSALCIIGIRVAPPVASAPLHVAHVLDDLRGGLRFVRDTSVLRSLLVVFGVLCGGLGLANALLLPFTERALHGGSFEYSLIEGIPMFGFVLSSLLMAHLANRLHPAQWITISLVAMGLLQLVIAGLTSVPLMIAVTFIASFMNAPSFIGRRLIIQRATPGELMGRVSSTFFVARDVALLVGMLAVGLADLIDIRLISACAGLLVLGAGLLALVLPGLRQPLARWRRAATADEQAVAQ